MSNRDDFSEATKRYLALRAGYRCSFSGCFQLCAGPSDASPAAVSTIGVAAHICAAAPGGPRYLSDLSAAERSDITNGIWLCANHARLIDADTVRYTADVLGQMKREHEAAVATELRRGTSRTIAASDLIAIGPQIICTGRYLEIEASSWSVQLEHFVVGDPYTLVSYIDRFDDASPMDQYIVVNELGDGRALAAAPNLKRSLGDYVLRCPVKLRIPAMTDT